MKDQLLEWIFERLSEMLCVSRKLIGNKAAIIYGDLKLINPDRYEKTFYASNGRLFNFIDAKKNVCSVERSWSFNSKNCLTYITCKKITNKVFIPTSWYYSIRWNTCLGRYGFKYNSGCCWEKTVWKQQNTKNAATVGLAAKGNGIKLKPFFI